MSFYASLEQPNIMDENAYWFIFRGYRLLVNDQLPEVNIPETKSLKGFEEKVIRRQYLGYLNGPSGSIHCYSAEVSKEVISPEGMEFQSLRQLFGRLDESFLSLAGRAVQIVDWDRTHQFCGRCGRPVKQLSYERAKKCPNCHLTSYPRLAPAIIVSIERDNDGRKEILLAHNQRNPNGFYSVLAGFVEPGESLEDCVRREIYEEVGLRVKNIRYFGSQPWPFPNSLMIGFTAEYDTGEIRLEVEEIDDAGWYLPENLPNVPSSISIARRLIDSFVDKNRN